MGEGWTVQSDRSLANFVKHAGDLYREHKFVMFSWTTGRQRTPAQNAAIHVFCREIAEQLNAGPNDWKMNVTSGFLKNTAVVDWTMMSVKELIWRPIQIALYPEKNSTTDLERTEVSVVAETITKTLAEKKGVVVHFADRKAGHKGFDK